MSNLLFRMGMLAVEYTGKWKWVGDVAKFLNQALVYILILVATAGTIYAVVLGVKMARAEDASAREEGKKKIINFVIALAATVLLIVLLKLFCTYLPDWIGIDKFDPTNPNPNPETGSGVIGLLNMMR